MLTAQLAHLAPPVVPEDLWRTWNVDVLLGLALIAALAVHGRGWRVTTRRRAARRWRRRAFVAAIVIIAVALVSPLDALSSSLASAHMVQHLLLTVVAAPLLVVSAPIPTLLRGLPPRVRRQLLTLNPFSDRAVISTWMRNVVLWAAVYGVVLWGWHAAGLYEAALRNDLLHRLEHVMLIATATLSWAAVLARRSAGIGVLVLCGLSVQGSLLGALLTFAPAPWYPTYARRTPPWGLSPLADQQLAGVIMWVPGGGAYLVAALALLTVWLTRERDMEQARPAGVRAGADRRRL